MTEETPKVQAGWVLVPREPDTATLTVILDEVWGALNGVGSELGQDDMRQVYRAMLAAIPATPAPIAGESGEWKCDNCYTVWQHKDCSPDGRCPECGVTDWVYRPATQPPPASTPPHSPGYSRAAYIASDTSLPARLDRLAQKWGDAPHETNLANTLREAAAELRGVPVEAVAKMLRERELTDAANDVLAERKRQIEVEKWHAAHDDEHDGGELAIAGACYALRADRVGGGHDIPKEWPWDAKWWKPKDQRRDLVRAAALIVAEIERLDRLTSARRISTQEDERESKS